MNRTNFNQTGGFPLKTERLQELETAYKIFNAFGMLAGNLTIISGCEQVGSNIANGFVYINGELLEFRTASLTAGSSVIIIEEQVNRAFKNGVIKPVHTIRYATFGTAETSWLWSAFTRIDTLKNIQSRILPPGTNPQLYSGSIANIPEGWQLCDGTNGTPNLKGRFIPGYDPDDTDYNAIGKTGGLKKVTPTASSGSSSVNITVPRDGWGTAGGPLGNVSSGRLVVGSGINENAESLESLRAAGSNRSVTSSHSHTVSVNEHENRPPYYTLAYIIYTG